VQVDGRQRLYVDGRLHGDIHGSTQLPQQTGQVCLTTTRVDADGLESLHSPATCVGEQAKVSGEWPRAWTAPAAGAYRVALDYANGHGPINTGITAAVKMLVVRCEGAAEQRLPLVMPHSIGVQPSTWGRFDARAGARCRFSLEDGFNMSYLAHFAQYTGGSGGSAGPLNEATLHDLRIAPLATGHDTP
jgi:hypothetical protein